VADIFFIVTEATGSVFSIIPAAEKFSRKSGMTPVTAQDRKRDDCAITKAPIPGILQRECRVPFEHAASAADTTPDAFTFTDLTDVPGSTLIESDIVQITGIDSIAPVSISGDGSPEYRICADATCTSSTGWFSFNSGIVNNQYLQLQLTSSGSYSTTLSAIIDIGDIADQWDVTTEAAPDNTPDAFSFTDQTDVSVSTQIQSNIVQITGISNGTNISIAGDGSPQYRICADGTCSTAPAYTGSAGTIDAGEYVQLRLTSSASNAATLSATLTIGTGSDQWDVTTEAPPRQAWPVARTSPTSATTILSISASTRPKPE
jgi:hypothetical protein